MKKMDKYESIVELARRRGFFWQSYEIYGGLSGFIDLGPFGVGLKRKIENKWRRFFKNKVEMVEISTPIITPFEVFEASGHIKHFNDPMIECSSCKRKYRADHILNDYEIPETESLSLEEIEQEVKKNKIKCPECDGELSKPVNFQTMFQTTIGPYSESVGYGRPETAQGMFINFKRINETMRGKFPIAIMQIGPALRNEISPRQGPIRLREFTLMEFEFFFDPKNKHCPKLNDIEKDQVNILHEKIKLKNEDNPDQFTIKTALDKGVILNEWLAYFMALSQRFVYELGIPLNKQRFNEKLSNERAHYSSQTFDHEVLLERWGWVEVAGHALRSNYDLSKHMKKTGIDLSFFMQHEKPIVQKKKILKPAKDVLSSKFGKIDKIIELLQKVDAEKIEKGFKEKGEYKIGDYVIQPDDIKIDTKEIKETGRRFIPNVAEPSFGLERLVYATLEYAYSKNDGRVVLKIPKDITPIQAIILPLVSKDKLPDIANKIYDRLTEDGFDVIYDEVGSIGRRYARADEIGIPIAITIDYQTIEDGTVTLRDRDSWEQKRVKIDKIHTSLKF
jgi:glycyl-tRNA synthetase